MFLDLRRERETAEKMKKHNMKEKWRSEGRRVSKDSSFSFSAVNQGRHVLIIDKYDECMDRISAQYNRISPLNNMVWLYANHILCNKLEQPFNAGLL